MPYVRFRSLATIVCAGLVAFGCGSDDDAAVATSTAVVDVSASTTTVADEALEESTDSTPTSSTSDEAGDDETFPAPALPVGATFEFDQRVIFLEQNGGDIYTTTVGELVRLDPDTGELEQGVLPEADELMMQPLQLGAAGESIVLSGGTGSNGIFNAIVTFDAATLQRTAEEVGPLAAANYLLQGTGSDDGTMLVVHNGEVAKLDVTTGSISEPVESIDSTDQAVRIDDEYWVWGLDGLGSVLDAETLEERATFDLETTLALFASWAVAVTDDALLVADGLTAEIFRVDRSTLDVTRSRSLAESFGPDVLVEASPSDPATPHVMVSIDPGLGWWVLAELDPASGDVVASHTVAPNTTAYWGGLGGRPETIAVGDRLFVQDNPRRLVEVDLDAFGEASGGAWQDPGIDWRPELDEVEGEIAQLGAAFASGEAVATTDLDRLDEAVGALNPNLTGWEAEMVTVAGDRAWVSLLPDSTLSWIVLTFERVDGAWLLDAESVCSIAYAVAGNPCELS